MRPAAPLLAALALAGCQPPRVEGRACDAGGRLGFALGETPGWFGRSPARPRSVTVRRVGRGEQVWNTDAPEHRLLARLIGGGEPERPVLVYGQALPGWTTSEPPAALVLGEGYWAHIRTDGGMATVEWIEGTPLPDCAGGVTGARSRSERQAAARVERGGGLAR